jgi:hypothetical protein
MSSVPPVASRSGRRLLALIVALLAAGSASCSGDESPGPPARTAVDGASETEAPVFSERDLDAFERGLRREIEAVHAAHRQSSAAATPEERGRAIQASFEHATLPHGAEAAGLPVDRYRAIREAVMRTFRTLDFQGRIDGPMEMDMSRATAEQKTELARDAFEALPASSAAALRARMHRLVPVWIEYVKLTAVAG